MTIFENISFHERLHNNNNNKCKTSTARISLRMSNSEAQQTQLFVSTKSDVTGVIPIIYYIEKVYFVLYPKLSRTFF